MLTYFLKNHSILRFILNIFTLILFSIPLFSAIPKVSPKKNNDKTQDTFNPRDLAEVNTFFERSIRSLFENIFDKIKEKNILNEPYIGKNEKDFLDYAAIEAEEEKLIQAYNKQIENLASKNIEELIKINRSFKQYLNTNKIETTAFWGATADVKKRISLKKDIFIAQKKRLKSIEQLVEKLNQDILKYHDNLKANLDPYYLLHGNENFSNILNNLVNDINIITLKFDKIIRANNKDNIDILGEFKALQSSNSADSIENSSETEKPTQKFIQKIDSENQIFPEI